MSSSDGTLCDVDGELFIKPCTQAEINFYEASIAGHPDFADFMPTYLGTLSLDEQGGSIESQGAALIAKHSANGTVEESFPNTTPHLSIAKHTIPEVVVPIKTGKRLKTHQAVVLENAAHGFVKPNIMDCKLGVRLWAEDAAEEKKLRYNKITEETTHKELGFRIAGMRVWQGKGATGDNVDQDGFKIYGTDYGRYHIQKHNVAEAFQDFIFPKSAGIDKELGQLLAEAFMEDLLRIQEVMEAQESRMVSSSILFIFEGDGVALRAAMEEASKPLPPAATNGGGDLSEDEDEDEPSGPKIYTVKVIDFAHAEWTPGMGPDENSLTGVRSLACILKNLAADVR